MLTTLIKNKKTSKADFRGVLSKDPVKHLWQNFFCENS